MEIGDEGTGIPPELEPRIFDRSVSGAHGTGLGLYLARSSPWWTEAAWNSSSPAPQSSASSYAKPPKPA